MKAFFLRLDEHASMIAEDLEGENVFELPEKVNSYLPMRFVLKKDKVIDRFPELTDEEVLEEIKRLEDEAAAKRRRNAVINVPCNQFIRRFTSSERVAITSSDDPIVKDFWMIVNLDDNVRIDAELREALDYLEKTKILKKDRAKELSAE